MRQLSSALLGLLLATSLAAQTPSPAPATPTPPPPTPVALDYDSLAFGRQLTDWFYAGQVDSLFAHSDAGMQANFPRDKWVEATGQWLTRAGMETSLVEERWVRRNGIRQYWRVMNVSNFPDGAVMLRWVLEPGKKIGGVGMNPASQAPTVDPN
ncbi:MAG TPA: hypothetical protein VFI13_04520 [Gemmatimonadales bacterium]|nr:hypothetical protein [Gemmatimonadales bacterium]